MNVLIFGATGGIGSELVKLFIDQNVTALSSIELDFRSNKFKSGFCKLKKYVNLIENSDIIINCAGVLGNNNSNYEEVFDVNFNSNWLLIRHFLSHPPQKKVKLIIVGSSSYKKGRDDYMLYSASKAALYNLFQGSVKYFEKSNLILGLINPTGVKTKMTKGLKGNFLSAKLCAEIIYKFSLNLKTSAVLDLPKKD